MSYDSFVYTCILMVHLVHGVRCTLHVYVNRNHTIELTVLYIIWAIIAIHLVFYVNESQCVLNHQVWPLRLDLMVQNMSNLVD